MQDRITANLPGRDVDAALAFYGAFGFARRCRDDGRMILEQAGVVVEVFRHPVRVPAQSRCPACPGVVDPDARSARFGATGLSTGPKDIPRITPPERRPPVPRMFAMSAPDGSLWRCSQTRGQK